MSDTPCLHVNTETIGDMPLADPVTYDFLGRFNAVRCLDCGETLSKERIDIPEQP